MDRSGKIHCNIANQLFFCKIVYDLIVQFNDDILSLKQDNTGIPVTLKLDSSGFFLYYYNQNDEITLIDIFHIRDIRNGKQARIPRDPKVN